MNETTMNVIASELRRENARVADLQATIDSHRAELEEFERKLEKSKARTRDLSADLRANESATT